MAYRVGPKADTIVLGVIDRECLEPYLSEMPHRFSRNVRVVRREGKVGIRHSSGKDGDVRNEW